LCSYPGLLQRCNVLIARRHGLDGPAVTAKHFSCYTVLAVMAVFSAPKHIERQFCTIEADEEATQGSDR